MADKETRTPVGTEPIPDSPELTNLKEREKVLLDKQKNLEKMDANQQARGAVDLAQVKRQNALQLAEVRKAIAGLKK